MNLTLFDLDGTLLPFDSNQAFGEYLAQIGWCADDAWTARNRAFQAAHDRGELDVHDYIDFATSVWRERPPEEQDRTRTAFVDEVLGPAIPASALALVARHRAGGDLVALVTGTNDFLAAPIARAFGIDHLIAVRLERDPSGRVTGRIDGTPSFHAGKIDRVNEWLAERGQRLQDFERSTFYGDSVNDAPLMERVTHPVAVSPSPALAAMAESRGWPVLVLAG